jgi:hypothetical protein
VLRIWLVMTAISLLAIGALLSLRAISGDEPVTAAARPAPTPGAIGSVGHLRNSVLFVDELGLSAWTRAYNNRDQKGQTDVMHRYETLSVLYSTPVKVTARHGDVVQVEMLDGDQAGRRGWTDAASLVP